MFRHIFKYRLLCYLRNTSTLFWMLVFPLVLTSFFYTSFSGLLSREAFEQIPVAVVYLQKGENNMILQGAMQEMNTADALFDVLEVNQVQAEALLEQEKTAGYIISDQNGSRIIARESSLRVSIMKEFMDQVTMMQTSMMDLMQKNVDIDIPAFIADLTNRINFVGSAAQTNNPDFTVVFFYSIFAMVCFYASFQGIEEIRVTQANQSSQAARISIAPTHKLKSFLAGICAVLVIQTIVLIVLFVYMKWILHIQFGNAIGHIALTCLIGSICGIFFGACLASILTTKQGTTESISAAIVMFLCFLSGMMSTDIKYYLEKTSVLFRYCNPVSLITDSLYALYYFDSYERWGLNLVLLSCMAIGLCAITFIILRRQRYASL